MTNEEVLAVFREAGALLEGHFILSSGRRSPVFLQKALVFSQPDKSEKLCAALAKKLTEKEKRGKYPQTDDEFLRAALILGLCGPNFYSPDRTVIWTEARLTRAVGLYQPTGFYED